MSLATFFALKARLSAAFSIVNSRFAVSLLRRFGIGVVRIDANKAVLPFLKLVGRQVRLTGRSPSFGGMFRLSRRSVSTPVFRSAFRNPT